MKQNLKMVGHFIVWCARNVIMSFVNSIRSLAFIHRTMIDGYWSTVESFQKGFVMGFLGAAISLMMTMGLTMAVMTLVYWDDVKNHGDDIIMTMRYSMGCTVLLYTVCFMHAMYRKFLSEYEATWNILKEKDDVSDLGR